jgi:hypothetical protein
MKELFNHPCFSIASIGVQFRGGPGGEALDFGNCEQIGVCIDLFGHSSGSLVLGRPLSDRMPQGDRWFACGTSRPTSIHSLTGPKRDRGGLAKVLMLKVNDLDRATEEVIDSRLSTSRF